MAMEYQTTEEAWRAGYELGLKNVHGIDCKKCKYKALAILHTGYKEGKE